MIGDALEQLTCAIRHVQIMASEEESKDAGRMKERAIELLYDDSSLCLQRDAWLLMLEIENPIPTLDMFCPHAIGETWAKSVPSDFRCNIQINKVSLDEHGDVHKEPGFHWRHENLDPPAIETLLHLLIVGVEYRLFRAGTT